MPAAGPWALPGEGAIAGAGRGTAEGGRGWGAAGLAETPALPYPGTGPRADGGEVGERVKSGCGTGIGAVGRGAGAMGGRRGPPAAGKEAALAGTRPYGFA